MRCLSTFWTTLLCFACWKSFTSPREKPRKASSHFSFQFNTWFRIWAIYLLKWNFLRQKSSWVVSTLYRVNLIDTGFSRVLVLATLTFGPRTDDRAGIVLVAFKLCSWQMKVLEAAMAQAAFLGEFFKEKQNFWGRKVMFLEKHWSSILGLSITSFMTRKAFNFSKFLFS